MGRSVAPKNKFKQTVAKKDPTKFDFAKECKQHDYQRIAGAVKVVKSNLRQGMSAEPLAKQREQRLVPVQCSKCGKITRKEQNSILSPVQEGAT